MISLNMDLENLHALQDGKFFIFHFDWLTVIPGTVFSRTCMFSFLFLTTFAEDGFYIRNRYERIKLLNQTY